jgi:peptide deformylase
MKSTTRHWLIAVGIVLLSACKSAQPFSEAEQALIISGDTPFRILQITDQQDSVVLRTPCGDLKNFAANPTFHWLIDRMKQTLKASDGVGLAAPQIGISKNIFLFLRLDEPGEPIQVVVNPRIVAHPDTTVCFERDGCLSIPDRSGNSVRYPWIDVEYWNEKGEKIREHLQGHSRQNSFTAIIFQHEYDHTRGILFTDKLCQ